MTEEARALIVVDVQNDFCEGGSLAVEGGAQVAADVADFLFGAEEYFLTVATQDWHVDPGEHFSDSPDFVHSWPRHCVAGTFGASLHQALAATIFDATFHKGQYAAAYSGFEGVNAMGLGLGEFLDMMGVEAVDVCGLALDYCVLETALSAAQAGYQTRILTDLTAAIHTDAASVRALRTTCSLNDIELIDNEGVI